MTPLKTCEHINDENKRDCQEEAVAECVCCASKVCFDHRRNRCMFGGQEFIDL